MRAEHRVGGGKRGQPSPGFLKERPREPGKQGRTGEFE